MQSSFYNISSNVQTHNKYENHDLKATIITNYCQLPVNDAVWLLNICLEIVHYYTRVYTPR